MKLNYVEPKGYFTKEMKKILEEGEKKTTKKTSSKRTASKSKKSK